MRRALRVDAFSYELPPERIAQHPTTDREGARLLVLPRGTDGPDGPYAKIETTVSDLAAHLPEGSLVVVNDTRVLPARLLGHKQDTGGRVEIFLVRHVGARTIDLEDGTKRDVDVWRALGKSSKPLRFGSDVVVGEPSPTAGPAQLVVHLIGRGEDGLLEVGLTASPGFGVRDAIRALGHVPLPPYIKRDDVAADAERYQTVFARVDGAVAAPTAGLHLSHALLGRLAVRGCEIVSVTLHVGLGTFQPVTVEDLDQHPMHAEEYDVPRSSADAIASARRRGAKVVAIGTTVARALESAAKDDGTVRPGGGETRLLIQPGYAFRAVDLLFTNFHLPRSTLLALVCAFGGTARVLDAYAHAVRSEYRFFSYGDAMLVARAEGT